MNKETLRQAKLENKIRQIIMSASRRGASIVEYVEAYKNEIMSLISQSESKEQSEFGPVDLTNVEPDKFNLKIKEEGK